MSAARPLAMALLASLVLAPAATAQELRCAYDPIMSPEWFATQQDDDGAWGAPDAALRRVGTTGLVVWALSSVGAVPAEPDPADTAREPLGDERPTRFATELGAGVRFLERAQQLDPDAAAFGRVGPADVDTLEHALATLALVHVAARADRPGAGERARAAIEHLLQRQRRDGSWRSALAQHGTAWAALALLDAHERGIVTDGDSARALERAIAALQRELGAAHPTRGEVSMAPVAGVLALHARSTRDGAADDARFHERTFVRSDVAGVSAPIPDMPAQQVFWITLASKGARASDQHWNRRLARELLDLEARHEGVHGPRGATAEPFDDPVAAAALGQLVTAIYYRFDAALAGDL